MTTDGAPKLVPDHARMRPRNRPEPRPASSHLALDRAEDDRLAAAVAKVGAEPFELLYQRYQQPLFRYCCGILGNRTEAEDALQEAMLSAYQSLLKHEGDLRFKPWIYSIARNACIDRIRQRKRVADQEPTDELLASVPSVEASSEQRELLRDLLTDMTELSESQRSALVLREMSGFSHEEISNVLETSPTKCKSLISEARQALTDRALGREMPCSELREAVEANGRRVLHGRRLQAHVSSCHTCSDFVTHRREHALAAFMPLLPILEARSLLQRVLESGGATEAATGAGLAAALTAIGAKKLIAAAAIVTAVGAGASQVPTSPDPATTKSAQTSAASKKQAGQSTGATKAKAANPVAVKSPKKQAAPTAGNPEVPASPTTQPTQPTTDQAIGEAGSTLADPAGQIQDRIDSTLGQAKSILDGTKQTIEDTAGQTGTAVDQTLDTATGSLEDTAGILGR